MPTVTGNPGHEVLDETTSLAQRRQLAFVGAGVTATDDAANNRTVVTVSGSGQFADEGTNLTQRARVNFVGAGVAALDDPANNQTVVTIPGGMTIADEGTNLPQRGRLNFVGAGVAAIDDPANNQTDVLIPGGGSSNHRHADREVLTFFYPGILPQARLDIDPVYTWQGFQSIPNGRFGGNMLDPGVAGGIQGLIWVESLTVTCDGQGVISPRNAQPFQVTVRQSGSGLAALTWNNSGSLVRQTWVNPFPPEGGTNIGICFAQSIFRVDSAQNANDRAGVYVHMYVREIHETATGYALTDEVIPL